MAIILLRVAVTRFEQRLVEAAERHKRFVIALFDNVAVFHYENDVGLLNRGQTVRDDKRRAPLHYFRKSLLYPDFRARIDIARRFVENQHRRVHKHYARDTQ